MDTQCHPPENLRVYTHVPVPLLDYIQRLCSGCHNSMLDREVGMPVTGHGLFANVGSAERTDSVSAHTYTRTHIHTHTYTVTRGVAVPLLFTSRQLRNWANRDRVSLATMEARERFWVERNPPVIDTGRAAASRRVMRLRTQRGSS